MAALFDALRKRGWVITESPGTLDLLPENLRARYPRVPTAVTEFLGRLESAANADENAWMLTPADFRKTEPDTFRWNEYEIMALDDAQDDPEAQSAIRAFWNAHLPIMLAVHSDYDYLAVRLAEPNFGSIVHGYAPEWEEPSAVARSFEEFIASFTAEALASKPESPYDVFL